MSISERPSSDLDVIAQMLCLRLALVQAIPTATDPLASEQPAAVPHANRSVAVQFTGERSKEKRMTQKIIEVVGTSKESFAKAAENAVAEAAKTVRGMKWARVAELEMELDGKKITKYRTTAKIYFEIEH